ncbi:hypothetical protein C5167_006834 [Papaver somniferum]|uniref:Xyloglucan endotransglucosylase/hydrolase n=1 Tax=Papaver somniferum TaxID=3469 RepID=A0A4Y7JHJ0_PAPSO|nr:hypothetical protein C5167_006834 [Papaver somniferum]
MPLHGLLITSSISMVVMRLSSTSTTTLGSHLYGHFDMHIKMVAGDSAGTVTAFYLSSNGNEHDEVDFEFLGNRTGEPYILQTNVFTGGEGNREQRIYLWFDPTAAYHTYSILWNSYHVTFFVDNIPIRIFKNSRKLGLKFPFEQPMKLYSRGGLEKTDWSKAPFIAKYRGFHIDACEASVNAKFCETQGRRWWDQKEYQDLDAYQYRRLMWVLRKFTIYNYCKDKARFPVMPRECKIDRDA